MGESLYTQIFFQLTQKEKNFEKAFEFAKKALVHFPGNKNIKAVIVNGLNYLTRELTKDYKTYPQGEELFKNWYKLMKDPNFDILLENYYSEIGIKYFENKDPDKGIEIIKKGLVILANAKSLKSNAIYIAGNMANQYFNIKDWVNGIKYSKIALDFDPQNESILANLKTVYRVMTYNEIEATNYNKALKVLAEGFTLFPKDEKLLYYQNYIDKKNKGK